MGRLIHISLFSRYVNPAALVSENSVLKALSAQVDHSSGVIYSTCYTLNCSVAWCERSNYWKAVTTTRQDSKAEDARREWERNALHPQENDESGSTWSSLARNYVGHPKGLERECGSDLPHLQVPSDYKEPVPPPTGSSGKGALQGENSCRFAYKETVSKEHPCLRSVHISKIFFPQVHLPHGRLRR